VVRCHCAARLTPLAPAGPDLVLEHLDVLEEYRQLCTREGRYEEAARATAELSRIRVEEEAARNAALRARHAAGERSWDEWRASWWRCSFVGDRISAALR
jgi:hypothetical protein